MESPRGPAPLKGEQSPGKEARHRYLRHEGLLCDRTTIGGDTGGVSREDGGLGARRQSKEQQEVQVGRGGVSQCP